MAKAIKAWCIPVATKKYHEAPIRPIARGPAKEYNPVKNAANPWPAKLAKGPTIHKASGSMTSIVQVGTKMIFNDLGEIFSKNLYIYDITHTIKILGKNCDE